LVVVYYLVRHSYPSGSGKKSMLTSALALLISIAVSALSWSCFERPILSWARSRFRY